MEKQMFNKLIFGNIFLLLWTASAAQASELTLSFSNRTAQLSVQQQLTNYDTGRSLLELRGIHNERDNNELVSASFDVLGPFGPGLEIGAGMRAYYININQSNDEVGAAGVGAMVHFEPPTLPRTAFTGSISYCPQVFNILDGEGLREFELSASFLIAPGAAVIASYTGIEADIKNQGNRTMDETVRIGLTLGF